MSAANDLLTRIREALKTTARRPVVHGGGRVDDAGAPGGTDYRRFLPRVGSSFEEQLTLFRHNALDLRAEFEWLDNAAALGPFLTRLRDREGWQRVAAHPGALTDAAVFALGLPVCRVDGTQAPRDLETCEVGLTECDALVAQTGTVVVTSRSAGGRALSCLPPHHVVLARRDQLVPGLPEALELLRAKYATSYPSMMSFITGPSRTGDIERILVLGAHGPRKLTIVCW